MDPIVPCTTCAIAADAITYTRGHRQRAPGRTVTAPDNHSPLFFVDDSGLAPAAEALTQIALDDLRPGTR